MSTGIIVEAGVKIYYLDFSNISDHSETVAKIEECKAYIRSQPKNSLLTLTNVTGMRFNGDVKDAFTTFVDGNKPYVKAGAVIGLGGLIQILYNAMLKVTGRKLKACSDKQDAINFLLSKN